MAMAGALFLGIPFSDIANQVFSTFAPAQGLSPLTAIPFFLLVGNIMFSAGISHKLILFLNSFLIKLPGSLNYIAVLACALFSSVSGPAPVCAAAVGQTLYPEMVKAGYPQGRSAALFASAGSLGSIIPPSVIMIVYAAITKISVADLFKAGLGIGILATIIFLIICRLISKIDKLEASPQKIKFNEIAKSFLQIAPIFPIPLIIFGGISLGLASPIQAGAASSVYAVLISVLFYKTLSFQKLKEALFKSISSSAMLIFIVACANAFSLIIQKAQTGQMIAELAAGLNFGPYLFIVLCMAIIVLAGMFIDGAAICILVVPALAPIAYSLSIDPVHFAMIVCIGAVAGSITPPFAISVFAVKSFCGLPVSTISKAQTPFYFGFFAVYILVAMFPALANIFN
jgi:C4-dicarboxylate transporter DctM subunit